MAKDMAMATMAEDSIVASLQAVTDTDGTCPFDTVAVYTDQLDPVSGGIKSAGKFKCFAFVAFSPADVEREGDFDACQILKFAVMIGASYDQPGVARRGDHLRYGTNKLREFVIAALDRKHPTYGTEPLDCDDFIYRGESLVCETPKLSIIELSFDLPSIMQ